MVGRVYVRDFSKVYLSKKHAPLHASVGLDKRFANVRIKSWSLKSEGVMWKNVCFHNGCERFDKKGLFVQEMRSRFTQSKALEVLKEWEPLYPDSRLHCRSAC